MPVEWPTDPNRLEDFKDMDLEILSIPGRSRLYRLEPIGVGTGDVESLTGYLTRLAHAHCVSTGKLLVYELLGRVAGEVISSGEPRRQQMSYSRLKAINGIGELAKHWVVLLESLTHRTGLGALTMLKWAEVLPMQGLLKPHRAWCPQCYVEDAVPYDRLLWALQAVQVCPHHRGSLMSVCPHCESVMPPIAWFSRPGHCAKCRLWLGLASASTNESAASEPLHSAMELVGLLSNSAGNQPPVARTRIASALQDCFARAREVGILGEQPRIGALARLLGLSRGVFWTWLLGKKLPQADKLLHLCHKLNVPLSLLLSANEIQWDFSRISGSIEVRSKQSKSRKPLDINRLRKQLTAILDDEIHPPLSMQEVTHVLSCARRSLTTHFPELCQRISLRYAAYVRTRSELKLLTVIEQMQQTAVMIKTADPAAKSKQVARMLSKPGTLKNIRVREAFEKLRQELEIE